MSAAVKTDPHRTDPDASPTLRGRLRKFCWRQLEQLSWVGLFCAGVFLAASVTPSLLPRPYVVQGILSGFAIAAGYGIGVSGLWVWRFLEFRDVPCRLQKRVSAVLAILVTGLIVAVVCQMSFWQNSIRQLMQMEPLETAWPYRTLAIAIVFSLVIIGLSRVVIWCSARVSIRLRRYLPPKVAWVCTAVIMFFLLSALVNGVLLESLLNAADESFAEIDELIDTGVRQPDRPLASGAATSLIDWASIGRRGKLFIVDGPGQQEIAEFTGQPAKEPLRIYVGYRSAEDEESRAALALEEMIRVGAFERSVLIVATPTGTGWLDPSAVDTVEYLHHGDTAIVSTQYSYLPSWLTIIGDPQSSRRSARALFDVVYEHWKTLPKDRRPRFFLHGLSLGSLGSEACDDLFTIFEDPIDGAVRSGPPFPSTQWAELTASRQPDSPAWRPVFRDSAMVRFTGQENVLDSGQRWGPIRSVYLQYASDPMVFFSEDLLLQEPEWMSSPRGPDVSPELRWYPVVTFLQIAFDLPLATSVPIGYGHNYAPAHYIDAWVAVTEPDWSAEEIARLKDHFRDRIPPGF